MALQIRTLEISNIVSAVRPLELSLAIDSRVLQLASVNVEFIRFVRSRLLQRMRDYDLISRSLPFLVTFPIN